MAPEVSWVRVVEERMCGMDGSSHRREGEVGGVSEGFDDEVEDE